MRPNGVLNLKDILDNGVLWAWWIEVCEVNTQSAGKGSSECFLNRRHGNQINLAEVNRTERKTLKALVTRRIATALVIDPSVAFRCVYQQMLSVFIILELATACEDVQKPHSIRFNQKFVCLLLRECKNQVVLVFRFNEKASIPESPCRGLSTSGRL